MLNLQAWELNHKSSTLGETALIIQRKQVGFFKNLTSLTLRGQMSSAQDSRWGNPAKEVHTGPAPPQIMPHWDDRQHSEPCPRTPRGKKDQKAVATT